MRHRHKKNWIMMQFKSSSPSNVAEKRLIYRGKGWDRNLFTAALDWPVEDHQSNTPARKRRFILQFIDWKIRWLDILAAMNECFDYIGSKAVSQHANCICTSDWVTACLKKSKMKRHNLLRVKERVLSNLDIIRDLFWY